MHNSSKLSPDERNRYLLENTIVNYNPPTQSNFIDHSGETHGRLTILKYIGKDKYGHAFYKCRCECENEIIMAITPILAGVSKSCGCLRRELTGINHTTHGLSDSHILTTWKNMTQRCYNKNRDDYPRYGGRGIYVCDEWLERDDKGNSPGFLNFVKWSLENGYSENLTIDRIDVNGPYAPWNCRWVGNDIQSINKRNNKYISYKGYNFSMNIWSKITGIPYDVIRARLNRGWNNEEILRTPPGYSRGKGFLCWEITPDFLKYNKKDE